MSEHRPSVKPRIYATDRSLPGPREEGPVRTFAKPPHHVLASPIRAPAPNAGEGNLSQLLDGSSSSDEQPKFIKPKYAVTPPRYAGHAPRPVVTNMPSASPRVAPATTAKPRAPRAPKAPGEPNWAIIMAARKKRGY